MGQGVSAPAPAEQGTQGASGEPVQRVVVWQEVEVNVGSERAAYAVRARVAAPRADEAQIYTLMSTRGVTLVHYVVESLDSPPAPSKPARSLFGGREPPRRDPVVECRDDDLLCLCVPPLQAVSESDRMRSFLLTLHLTLPECGSMHNIFYVRLPVLRCLKNFAICHMHGDGKALDIETDPPLTPTNDARASLSGAFPSTTELALQWAPRCEAAGPTRVCADAAELSCAADVSVEDAAGVDSGSWASVDVNFDVKVHEPFVDRLARESELVCVLRWLSLLTASVQLEGFSQDMRWDWLQLESDPAIVFARQPAQGDGDAYAPSFPVPALAGRSLQTLAVGPSDSKAENALTLLVDTNAVCCAFGRKSVLQLAFTIRGRAMVPLLADVRRNPHAISNAVALPGLHIDGVEEQFTVYSVRDALPRASRYQLELAQPVAPGHASLCVPRQQPVETRVATHQACIVAIALAEAPAYLAENDMTAPLQSAPLRILNVRQDVWPHATDRSYVQMRVQVSVHGPLPEGSLAVLLLPRSAEGCVVPAALAAVIDGAQVPAHFQSHVNKHSGSKGSSASRTSQAIVVEARTGTGQGSIVNIDVSYVTPWRSGTPIVAVRPAFPVAVPAYEARVHGFKTQVPRLAHDSERDAGHVVYAEALTISELHVRAMKPKTYEVELREPTAHATHARPEELAARIQPRRPTAYASRWLYMVVPCVSGITCAILWRFHAQLSQALARIDILAMALDIDFSDSQWSATSAAKMISHTASRVHAASAATTAPLAASIVSPISAIWQRIR